MKNIQHLIITVLLLVIPALASSQTITGCRTRDAQWIYYTPANPSDNGNIYNRTFFFLSTDRYATNYNEVDIACTVKKPVYIANTSGLSGDFGGCKIKFFTGDVDGEIYRGSLTPCNIATLPIDDYIPFFLFLFGSLGFYLIQKRLLALS